MTALGNATAGAADRSSANAQCPHVLFRDVLGAATVAALLEHVAAREHEFVPTGLRNRYSGEEKIDRTMLDRVFLAGLGPFATRIEALMRAIADEAAAALRLAERALEPREFEFAAYRDGGRFGSHIDTDERLHRVRVLSCVYYFAATPCRFAGGELRLHGFPHLAGQRGREPAPHVDIAAETDTLVVFPSWLRHEVLPVRVPSRAWADSRFTINCWMHRADRSVG